MDFSYDNVADALYIYINRGEVKESKEVKDNIVVDYNFDDEIYGIEILDFSKSDMILNELIKLSDTEIVANVVAS